MSPVSRGRKRKKPAKRTTNRAAGRAAPPPAPQQESVLAVLRRAFGSTARPAWFDDAIHAVLDGASALVDATGPRELDQRTTELVGAQIYRAIHDTADGLRFDWWFAELADATRTRLDEAIDGDEWRAPYWLLHGLAAIAPPSLVPKLPTRGFVRALNADPAPPTWLSDATRVVATGEVWCLRDAYGTRYGVIAGFRYPHFDAEHVLLLDIDASGFIVLAGVGMFDDVAQAAAAWRDSVGDTAAAAHPEPVTDPDQLLCLIQLDPEVELGVRGDEPRSVTDNWFRVDRRIRELHAGMRKAGMALPTAANLYRDLDVTVMTRPFTEWCAATGAAEPGRGSVEALAEEWMEGTLPETWFSVSPRRVAFQLELMNDWIADDVTAEVGDLMPVWTAWLGDRGGLSETLRQRVIAAATPRTSDA